MRRSHSAFKWLALLLWTLVVALSIARVRQPDDARITAMKYQWIAGNGLNFIVRAVVMSPATFVIGKPAFFNVSIVSADPDIERFSVKAKPLSAGDARIDADVTDQSLTHMLRGVPRDFQWTITPRASGPLHIRGAVALKNDTLLGPRWYRDAFSADANSVQWLWGGNLDLSLSLAAVLAAACTILALDLRRFTSSKT
ncbi:MAG: hypothetical protein JO263_01545 [Candidatus Eremiobacteraeota bacterium]|nr:hypothetical protein [Candidatus Eremiobacteraeota bacterium]